MVGRRTLLKRAGAAVVAGVGAAELGDSSVAAAPSGSLAAMNRKMGAPVAVAARALILLDRSGSMQAVKEATVEGLNRFFAEQRDKPDLYLTLLQFDAPEGTGLSLTEVFVDVPAPQVRDLTADDFQPRGSTPLLAAVASAIARFESLSPPARKNLMVFQTDGEENASPPEITKQVIKELIEARTNLGNWTFAFMGADIDAWGEGGSLGVSIGNTMQYQNNARSTVAAYTSTSGSTSNWYNNQGTSMQNFYDQGDPTVLAQDVSLDFSPSQATAVPSWP